MNKKLIKTIASITCGLGIVATIPFAATSCGCSNTPMKVLPYEVYDIDETNNVLKGFKDDFLNNPHSKIYQDKFRSCDTIEIPSYVTSIEDGAFYENSISTIPWFITKLTFSENSNCLTIGNNAFQDSTIISADLLNSTSLTEICNFSFSTCLFLTSVILPSSLTTIGQSAFLKCTAISSIDLSKTNLTTIGQEAFEYCSALTSVMLPDKLTTIGAAAFDTCSSLISVTFPSSLTTIGTAAFNQCFSLSSVTFPSSLTTIGTAAFSSCTSLTSVDFSNCSGLTTIDKMMFWGCSSLTSLSFPENLSTIDQFAFKLCSSLASVDFSKYTKLNKINRSAFGECTSLTSITFPSSLTTIGQDAFEYCSNLSNIIWNNWSGSFVSLSNIAFSGVCQDGRIDNIIDDDVHDSTALLQYLKNNGGLPSKWTAV